MWMWHHWFGFGVLLQDRETHALRVVDIPDDECFYYRDGLTEAEVDLATERYVTAAVTAELRSTERRVPLAESIRMEGEDAEPTSLPCPECGSLLYWRHTGIS